MSPDRRGTARPHLSGSPVARPTAEEALTSAVPTAAWSRPSACRRAAQVEEARRRARRRAGRGGSADPRPAGRCADARGGPTDSSASEEIAALITAENGKPIKWARIEVTRAASVFRWAAEEARRWSGDVQRLDTEPAAAGRLALVQARPQGSGARHRAVQLPAEPGRAQGRAGPRGGRPDPASSRRRRPRCRRWCSASCWPRPTCPRGMWSVLPVPNDRMAALVADPRLPIISFTGSAPVGYSIREAVPHKHVVLELGGNAAAVVLGDYGADADLRVGRPAHRDVRQLPGRPVVHLGAAGARRPTALRRGRRPGRRRGGEAGHRRRRRPCHRRRSARRRERGRAGRRRGSTRRWRPGPSC